MANSLLTELPYFSDSARLFEAVANKPWAVFLDSGYPATQQGRYDFISADPMAPPQNGISAMPIDGGIK